MSEPTEEKPVSKRSMLEALFLIDENAIQSNKRDRQQLIEALAKALDDAFSQGVQFAEDLWKLKTAAEGVKS